MRRRTHKTRTTLAELCKGATPRILWSGVQDLQEAELWWGRVLVVERDRDLVVRAGRRWHVIPRAAHALRRVIELEHRRAEDRVRGEVA